MISTLNRETINYDQSKINRKVVRTENGINKFHLKYPERPALLWFEIIHWSRGAGQRAIINLAWTCFFFLYTVYGSFWTFGWPSEPLITPRKTAHTFRNICIFRIQRFIVYQKKLSARGPFWWEQFLFFYLGTTTYVFISHPEVNWRYLQREED